MKHALAAAALALALPISAASADTILVLGQSGTGNTITGTANAAGTQTTISGTDVPVTITADTGGVLGGAFLDLSATSTDAAVPVGTGALQHYTGSFSVFTGAGMTGTDILSGTFSDAALGVGPALTLAIGAPPDSITLTSDLLTAAQLALPAAISFALSNITPPISIDNQTLASFTGSIGQTVSASTVAEPGALALLGAGLIGLGMVRRVRGARSGAPPQSAVA